MYTAGVSDADEPYFTVLTHPRFLRKNLTDASRREFFAGGEALVDFMWRTIQLRLAPDFAPTHILEDGCGGAPRDSARAPRRPARRAGDRSRSIAGHARGRA